ncbi:phosphodiester glycosidase family protein [Chryseobacterium sp. SSA4.19]|uniref:phosphodiester glycosidase family protein n=1 Tax=Chryseobacterium sp. SSA4.19 TaxID=2919915 RepID=UPI001F4E0474|nr:phosphodiester glycosidase family protein [Chryseobacterium sp. SSA4.19]MCJ8152143.1 phosphodiester glycosidase family protein [Chryseobacterium sp. SSA4.19]
MKLKLIFFPILIILFSCSTDKEINSDFVIYPVNSKSDRIEFFWKDNHKQPFRSLQNLEKYINSGNKDLIFAMNGGMFIQHNIPKGLYVENFKTLNPINTLAGKGNFYLKPNGIFYVTKSNESAIVSTENFKANPKIKFATQSGPMLIIDGKINPAFQNHSRNLNIRNGVGILKNGSPVFVMSKKEINLYSLASLFKSLECENALYLDGFVSRTYFPKGNWIQKDGDFGVIIGIIKEK